MSSTRPYFEAIARQAGAMPQARYVLPQFEERTAYGFKRQDPYAKLFEDRIVFMGVQVDDASADDIMAQLLVLESQDPDGLITMYINSPGGSFTALTAIYDTMQYIKPQVQTVCLGQAASAAAVLLAAGSEGKRLALPNARVLIHQPAMEGVQGQASDIEIVANEIDRMRSWLEDTLAAHTGRDREKIHADLERDKILTAADAKEYGIVDQVLTSRKAPATPPEGLPGRRPAVEAVLTLSAVLPHTAGGALHVQPVEIKLANAGSVMLNVAYCGLDTPPRPRRTCRMSP